MSEKQKKAYFKRMEKERIKSFDNLMKSIIPAVVSIGVISALNDSLFKDNEMFKSRSAVSSRRKTEKRDSKHKQYKLK